MSTYQSRKVAHKAKRDKLLGTVCCNCGMDVGSSEQEEIIRDVVAADEFPVACQELCGLAYVGTSQ